jgi:hypothetical protein
MTHISGTDNGNVFYFVNIHFLVLSVSFVPICLKVLKTYLIQGSGYFFHDKMPGYRLLGLAAATTLHFTACQIKHPLSQKPTASFAYPGGCSQLLVGSAGAIILP